MAFDGLWEVRGNLDTLDGEALATVLDALETPDPPDTPPERRRSPGQRRADALGALARQVLDAGDTPTVQGNRPHLLLFADLATLVGRDEQASRAPRMRFTDEVTPEFARRFAREAALRRMGPPTHAGYHR